MQDGKFCYVYFTTISRVQKKIKLKVKPHNGSSKNYIIKNSTNQ